jgi:hypothetical protein
MTIHEIMSNLQVRGVLVNPPLNLSSDDWNEVVSRFKCSSKILSAYRWFDGFQENTLDQQSLIDLWPISKINKMPAKDFQDQLVIGDTFLQSDFIVVDDRGSIKLAYENKLLANSLIEFLSALCDGSFDF